MEKGRPHRSLKVVRALVAARQVRTTRTAAAGASALGCGLPEMLQVIQALKASDFHKSMTTHADHTVWQDVYRPHTPWGDIYLKLTVVDDVLIVSFKELGS